MAFQLIAYPRIIYVQSAEPDDKTAGRLWQDSDDNQLYVGNGTSYASVSTTPSVVASATELISNATERTLNDPAAYTLIKEIVVSNIPQTNTLRVTFDMKSSVNGRESAALIYVNGSSLGGTTHTNSTDTYATKTEDLTNIQMGSRVQIYVKYTGLNTNILVRNFKLLGTCTPNESVLGASYDLSNY